MGDYFEDFILWVTFNNFSIRMSFDLATIKANKTNPYAMLKPENEIRFNTTPVRRGLSSYANQTLTTNTAVQMSASSPTQTNQPVTRSFSGEVQSTPAEQTQSGTYGAMEKTQKRETARAQSTATPKKQSKQTTQSTNPEDFRRILFQTQREMLNKTNAIVRQNNQQRRSNYRVSVGQAVEERAPPVEDTTPVLPNEIPTNTIYSPAFVALAQQPDVREKVQTMEKQRQINERKVQLRSTDEFLNSQPPPASPKNPTVKGSVPTGTANLSGSGNFANSSFRKTKSAPLHGIARVHQEEGTGTVTVRGGMHSGATKVKEMTKDKASRTKAVSELPIPLYCSTNDFLASTGCPLPPPSRKLVYATNLLEKNTGKSNVNVRDYELLVETTNRLGQTKQEMSSLYSVGVLYDNQSRYKESVKKYERMSTLAKRSNNRMAYTIALNALGNSLFFIGTAESLERSHACHYEHSTLAQTPRDRFVSFSNVGLVLVSLGDEREGSEWMKRALGVMAEEDPVDGARQDENEKPNKSEGDGMVTQEDELHTLGLLTQIMYYLLSEEKEQRDEEATLNAGGGKSGTGEEEAGEEENEEDGFHQELNLLRSCLERQLQLSLQMQGTQQSLNTTHTLNMIGQLDLLEGKVDTAYEKYELARKISLESGDSKRSNESKIGVALIMGNEKMKGILDQMKSKKT
ncbi:hypothetical protein BLNAU_15775 [Blattamonas nauphoetae]|uniref:Uncharacterized protein n=1 Tax=Blattamonas nauphoetae TaxID=2049346 RepID=A0ABQ9XC94_9EUKA|nr:hypothetical protein BLNAU_15775 [Blattamonas nauphoetae]